MPKLNMCLIIGIALGVSTPQLVPAQSCRAEITSPQKGDTVETAGEIRGTATVPPGMFLWIFVHREGLADWWPESGGPAKPKGAKSEWVVHATFGDEKNPSKDAKAAFEIIAAVVGPDEHKEIANYVKQTKETGSYPGITIDLPPSPPGCASETIVVRRR
jgi:hypothetical protein